MALWAVLKATFKEFNDDNCPSMAASLSYATWSAVKPITSSCPPALGGGAGDAGCAAAGAGSAISTGSADHQANLETNLYRTRSTVMRRSAPIAPRLALDNR